MRRRPLKRIWVVGNDDARRYRKTLYAFRRRLLDESARRDESFRIWADRHVAVIDELLRAIGGRPRA